ncbi:MAG: DUF1501 domain-containing protein [Bacteroidetes bacterium]|nr:DUF1501 domain-containing protein [Bacteroidota bacterium]
MNRRKFVRNSAIIASMYPLLRAVEACHTRKSGTGKKIFILIQLLGGNDGLHTLIPMDDNYGRLTRARPNIYLPENKILPIKGTSIAGLHPALIGIQDMYDHGLAGFVQGVGYDNPNFSHFRSSDIWLTGSESSQALYTGWMARYLEGRFKNYPDGYPSKAQPDPPGIKIGDTGSFLFQGKAMDMSIVVNPAIPFGASGTEDQHQASLSFGEDEVKVIREILLQTDKYSATVKKALDTPFASSKLYPKKGENSLADQLKVVSQLIHGGLDTSVYVVDLKNFDTHVEQVSASDRTKGNHANLLGKLSQAIACFWDDVVHMGREDDIAGMTFSEFGRRIASTSGLGTDHGSSQPILFFGNSIDTQLIGKNPFIPDKVSVDDNLAMQYDFKSIFTSVLQQWFDAPADQTTAIFQHKFDTLPLFKS